MRIGARAWTSELLAWHKPILADGLKGECLTEVPRDTVAIVDDDHAVRQSLGFLLEAIGHKIETFASATEFLKACLAKFVCLIVDHHMPDMTGLELAARLRAEGSTVPIMPVTGSPSRANYARAAELGNDGVLEKPLDKADLMAFIDTATRRL
jgi:FixJ family two-component response regulator